MPAQTRAASLRGPPADGQAGQREHTASAAGQPPAVLPAPLDSALQVGIWRHTLGSDVVVLNGIAARLLGLEGRQAPVALSTLMAAVHPADRPRLMVLVRSRAMARRRREPRPIDVRLTDPEHAGRWMRLRLRPAIERGPSGQPVALLGICVDITDQHAQAEHTRSMVHRFEAIGQAAGIGFWSYGPLPSVSYWSRQMFALHERPESEPPPDWDTWVSQHVFEADRERVQCALSDWLASGQPVHDMSFRLQSPQGQVREVIAHARLHQDGDACQAYGLLIDVTSRNQAERAARRSAEKTQLIAKAMGLGTWERDLVTGESLWDEQMWRLRGREPRDSAPTRAEGRAMLHPDDRSALDDILGLRIHETGPLEYEFRVLLPDGTPRWLASRSTTECDATGRPVRRIGINWDVTETRLAHIAREERLAAQRELKAKAQFLSRMSHELRTPLNAVLGFAQLLRSESGRIDDATRRGWVEQIEAAGQHLAALIDDVLDLSSMEGGEVAVRCGPVALPGLVASVLALVNGLAEEYQVTLELGELDLEVWADATRLRQVLLNLISNAIKYNRPGGQVHILGASDGTRCTITIQDTGRGLSTEQLAHLFEPFNRLGAENSEVPGNGIGLAIAKALVERMGGHLHLSSRAEQGTTVELDMRCVPVGQADQAGESAFWALDPLTQPDALLPLAAQPEPGSAVPRWGGRLLYIEDNPVNAMIVSELAAQYPGVEIRCCDTGASGIDAACAWHPDLILLDMQLPDMAGERVFELLQQRPECARIPCIALSANAMGGDIDRALRSGFVAYWTKPLDFALFHATATRLFKRAA